MKRKSNFIDYLKTATEIAWPTTSYMKRVLEILNLQKATCLSSEIAADVQQVFITYSLHEAESFLRS
jgi:hypothetical protein